MQDANPIEAPAVTTTAPIYAAVHMLLAAIRGAETPELAQEAARMAVIVGAQALQDIAGRTEARALLEVVIGKLNEPGRMLTAGTTH